MRHIKPILNIGLTFLFILNSTSSGVRIVNNLSHLLYLQSVSNVAGPIQKLDANGGRYYEDWQTNPDGGGISIKMAIQPDMSDIIQFEYTVQGTVVYWDVSLINTKSHSPFMDEGFAVIPDQRDCIPAICRPFDAHCPDVYYHPDDNFAVRGCSQNIKLQMTIGHERTVKATGT